MTISVTFQFGNSKRRKDYNALGAALRSIKKWLCNNSGFAMLYQPEKIPVVYQRAEDVPYHQNRPKGRCYLIAHEPDACNLGKSDKE